MHTVGEISAAGERRFFAWMAFVALAVVFAGFAGSYYLRPLTVPADKVGQPPAPLPLVVHVHALMFTTWIVLVVVQAALVAIERTATHRRLGVLAAGLFPAMIVAGLLVAVRGARDGWNPGGPYVDAASFMFVGVADLVVFGALTTAGLASRHRPARHRRLMLLGTLGGLMWPAITRMPIVAGRPPLMFGLIGLLVLVPAVRDVVTRSRERWWMLGLALVVLATFPLRVVIANSGPWRAIATWLLG